MDSNLPCFILFILIGCVTCSSDDHHHHNATRRYDYCVLGAGPAGLQMGYFLSKANRDYIILERNSGPGSFFNKYPRHRKLISINKFYTGRQNREFNLRHDWNSLLSDKPDLLFKRVSSEFYPPADAFPLYLSMFVKELGLRVRYGVDIGRIRAVQSSTGRSYILTDQHVTDYTCSVLLAATGLWVPQKVEFLGSDLVEGYESISTNPEDYKDQAVLILGKGNSAFETAQSILGRASRVHLLSSSPVRLAWQTHYVGDLRAVNNEIIDTYQLKSLDGLVEASLDKIVIVQRKEQGRRRSGTKNKEKKRQLYLTLKKYIQDKNSSEVTGDELPGYHLDNYAMRKPYDRVIRCLGFRFNFSVFDSSACPPNSDNAKGRLPGVTAWYEGTNTPGLFVLGTAAHSRDYRLSAGGFIHGFRYTGESPTGSQSELLTNTLDVAHTQSLQIASLKAVLQDTVAWDPTSPPQPSSSMPRRKPQWSEVVLWSKKRTSLGVGLSSHLSLSNRFEPQSSRVEALDSDELKDDAARPTSPHSGSRPLPAAPISAAPLPANSWQPPRVDSSVSPLAHTTETEQ
uniref:FAD-dependent oxidoreductase domain-containing protein 2 n=1 Tax=Epinephelus lanceolatus TaxID=310571 RepID=UPI00144737B4|nr:FAD-dependent oxidoreductase domain-containing protein 2 [Epinephelus lanceolatus]